MRGGAVAAAIAAAEQANKSPEPTLSPAEPVKRSPGQPSVLARFQQATSQQKQEAAPQSAAPAPKKLGSNNAAMRNQLESMMKRGAGGGMMFGGGGGGGGGRPGADAGGDPAAQPPPEVAPPEVEYTGELGIPVSKEPRLQHFTRARGPPRRRPAGSS